MDRLIEAFSVRQTKGPRITSEGLSGSKAPSIENAVGLDYFGSTAWKSDFAVESTSSAAAVVRSRTEGSAASARRSSGRESGISAGGGWRVRVAPSALS